MSEREPEIGDFVFIHLREGLDPKQFGGTLRVGTVTDIGLDALFGEVIIQLDDGGPRIYRGHILDISNHGSSVEVG